jgi:caffeoyl-CoA O-methyltransferase
VENLFANVDHYISSLLIHEDEVLTSVAKSLRDANLPFGTVSPNQGKFLHIMALACKARNILELGTLGGYSAIWLARALPEDGKLVTVELEPAHAFIAKQNIERAGLSDKIEIRIGNAINILQEFISERHSSFDMIFIDADKPPYSEYFLAALKLSHPGTFIIADNVIREGKVLEENKNDEFLKGVKRFNNTLSKTSVATSTIIQTVGIKPHDGFSLSIVR